MEEKFLALQGGVRPWWDVLEHRLIKAGILYLPQGCPDWGETKGERNTLCTFCSLPYAASDYRLNFYGSKDQLSQDEHLRLFTANFESIAPLDADIHTLMVFNAGSFLADVANTPETQTAIAEQVSDHPTIKRFVVESRAELVTSAALERLMKILGPAGKRLAIRIGVETQNDTLRTKVLRKGHSRKQLFEAVRLMKAYGVESGGYVLLNSAPLNDLRLVMQKQDADETDVYIWAMQETQETLEWVLGNNPDQLGMDEAYFCSTNVGPGTPLTEAWQKGDFQPASLWMVFSVLKKALTRFSGRVHLLPFKDEPPLLAVPSNHVSTGILQDLSNAEGCDILFHQMFDCYRKTFDPRVLVPPNCTCCQTWM